MSLDEIKKIEDEKLEMLRKEKDLRLKIKNYLDQDLIEKTRKEKGEEFKQSFRDFFENEGFLIKEENQDIIAEYKTFKATLSGDIGIFRINIPQMNYIANIFITEKFSVDFSNINPIEDYDKLDEIHKKIEKLQKQLDLIECYSSDSMKMNFRYNFNGTTYETAKELLQAIIDCIEVG